MKYCFIIISWVTFFNSYGQQIDQDLANVRGRLDSIESFTADIVMDVDISFINMPTKQGKVSYIRGKGSKISSKDFIMLPKRGLDLTMEDIFKYPFITVQRGQENTEGVLCKVLNIIPTSEKADFSIATIYLDQNTSRIIKLQVSTKKEGVYTSLLSYSNAKTVLPSLIEVLFEVSNIKIPLQFLGKETEVDKEAMKEDGTKTGRILLRLEQMVIVP